MVNKSFNKSRKSVLRQWLPLLTLALLPMNVAYSDVQTSSSGVTTTAATAKTPATLGLKIAVVAAADESGKDEVALRALQAANIGLQRQPGYQVMDPETVAKLLRESGLQWPFAPKQYPQVRKALTTSGRAKTERILAVSVAPQPGANATCKAVVELYDTQTGGLVGRGESLYTVSSTTNDDKGDPQMRAVDGAVLGAIAEMSKPATLNGVVISRPQSYAARLSLGSLGGLRTGARIEYLANGTPIAYGTVIDLGTGESVATVAPESAYGKVQVNTAFRTAGIPPVGLQGASRNEISKQEFDSYTKRFAVSSVLATIAYLIVR